MSFADIYAPCLFSWCLLHMVASLHFWHRTDSRSVLESMLPNISCFTEGTISTLGHRHVDSLATIGICHAILILFRGLCNVRFFSAFLYKASVNVWKTGNMHVPGLLSEAWLARQQARARITLYSKPVMFLMHSTPLQVPKARRLGLTPGQKVPTVPSRRT